MSIIKIYSSKSKPAKKKPGWREAEQQEAEWLQGIQRMSLSGAKSKAVQAKKPAPSKIPVIAEHLRNKAPSLISTGGSCTKPVARPEIMYRDNPEMLERELKARERKFCTAPAYNKGNDVYITDEMMKDITAGLTRRR